MTLNDVQYMALSALSYTNLEGAEGLTINDLINESNNETRVIKGYKDEATDQINPEFQSLSSLGSWTLVDYQEYPSGLAAMAFENPTTHEIVFAFRGTEPSTVADIRADLDLALDALPSQFTNADSFVSAVMAANPSSDYSFTGHSLGGGVVQWVTHKAVDNNDTRFQEARTFNAVGIGQLDALNGVNPRDYDDYLTDYVNERDVIGALYTQLGKTKFLQDTNTNQLLTGGKVEFIAEFQAIQFAMINGDITPQMAQLLTLWLGARSTVLSAGNIALDYLGDYVAGEHDMSDLLVQDTNGNYVLAAENSNNQTEVQEVVNVWEMAGNTGSIIINEGGSFGITIGSYITITIPSSIQAGVDIVANLVRDVSNGNPYTLQNFWDAIGIGSQSPQGTDGDDVLTLTDGIDNKVYGLAGNDVIRGYAMTDLTKKNAIYGGDGDDDIIGSNGVNFIDGGNGDDYIEGGDANDVLYGGDGTDVLKGHDGDDYLDGGYGHDLLYGGAGNDTYVFGVGYGWDAILLNDKVSGDSDTINFITSLEQSDIVISRTSDDLIFTIGTSSDYIAVINYFSASSYGIRALFDDGTQLTDASIRNIVKTYVGSTDSDIIHGYGDQENYIYGQAGNDIIYGKDYNDKLYGGAGNDTLVGGAGVDLLDGGSGNDLLDGGNDMDTYLFGRGYGTDTIVSGNYNSIIRFNDGVTLTDLHIERSHTQTAGAKDDLLITILDTGDTLVIKDYFTYTTKPIFQFHDNSYLTEQDIATAAKTYKDYVGLDTLRGWDDTGNTIYGLYGDDTIYGAAGDDTLYGDNGNDTLYGNAGDDTLVGGTGNDKLYGGAGNDTYMFDAGFGSDIIEDQSTSSTADKIVFGAGISAGNVILKRIDPYVDAYERYDVEITFTNSHDRLLIKDFYDDEQGRIESIKFTNGNVTWDLPYLLETLRHVDGTAGNDSIYGYADQSNIIHGGDGDDYIDSEGLSSGEIYGGAGNDTIFGSGLLNGGTGDDKLYGGQATDDTYVYNLGDGNDMLYEYFGAPDTSFDTLKFGPGITPSGVTLSRPLSGLDMAIADLVIAINSTGHTVTIKNFFPYVTGSGSLPIPQNVLDSHGIEQIVFDDNTVWTADNLYEQYKPLIGTSGNDEITGLSTDDIIYGGAGDDDLYGYYGDDTLDGGAGDDLLRGAYGSDTYKFGRGYGTDTIDDADYSEIGQSTDKVIFNSDVDPSDIEVSRGSSSMFDLAYRDLHLHIKGTSDTLIIKQYFMSDDNNQEVATIEEIHFSDATVWELSDVNAALAAVPNVINGTSGMDILIDTASNDTINAGDGDDTIIMMNGGNDTINGGAGNDTYYWVAPGFGQDKIVETSGTDIAGVTGSSSDMIFEQIGDDLRLSIYGTTDSVTVQDWYTSSDKQVETFMSITDMGSISNTQIEQLIQAMATFSTNNNGMTWSQALASQPNDVQSIVSQYWTVPTA